MTTNVLAMPVKNAKLPAVYERAKEALQKCSSIDECAEWKNKAEAIASYARQSEDESLFLMASRIKARAIRRCGQLLKEIESAQGERTDLKQLRPAGGPKLASRAEVAGSAGLSRRQRKTALSLADVDEAEFEAAIERKKPATVTELTNKKPPSLAHLHGRDPADFLSSTKAQGALHHFFAVVSEHDPKVAVRGALSHETKRMRIESRAAIAWLEKLLAELEKGG